MTARQTFSSSVASAEATKVVAVTTAVAAAQETINQSGCNVGYNLQTGNYANFAAGVKSANAAKLAALNAAEVARQQSIMVARDTLRSTGDVGPV